MSGLLSSLTLSTAIATSAVTSVPAPPAPSIPDQTITRDAPASGAANSDTMTITQDKPQSTATTTTDDPDGLLTGVDVASHQHRFDAKIDIPEIVKGGNDFAFIKATEGTEYINPHFRSDVMQFMAQKNPMGFYHYAKPTDSTEDARQQAQHFVSVTGIDRGVKSFPPVLDIEEDGGVSSEGLIDWTEAFVDEVKELTGRDVMIYTYPNFWRDKMANTTKFNRLPLWLASYNGKTSPGELPGGWDDWTFWQYTSEGNIPGSPKGIDMNLFNGSSVELSSLYTAKNKAQQDNQ